MKTLNTLFAGVVLLALAISLHAQTDRAELIQEMLREKLIAKKAFSSEPSHFNLTRDPEEHKFTSNFQSEIMEGEPTIAVNPANPNNLVVSFMSFENGTLEMPIYVTKNAGESWTQSTFSTTAHFQDSPSRSSLSLIGGGDPILRYAARQCHRAEPDPGFRPPPPAQGRREGGG